MNNDISLFCCKIIRYKFDSVMSERQLRATGRNTDMVASFLLKTYEILEVLERVDSILTTKR